MGELRPTGGRLPRIGAPTRPARFGRWEILALVGGTAAVASVLALVLAMSASLKPVKYGLIPIAEPPNMNSGGACCWQGCPAVIAVGIRPEGYLVAAGTWRDACNMDDDGADVKASVLVVRRVRSLGRTASCRAPLVNGRCTAGTDVLPRENLDGLRAVLAESLVVAAAAPRGSDDPQDLYAGRDNFLAAANWDEFGPAWVLLDVDDAVPMATLVETMDHIRRVCLAKSQVCLTRIVFFGSPHLRGLAFDPPVASPGTGNH